MKENAEKEFGSKFTRNKDASNADASVGSYERKQQK